MSLPENFAPVARGRSIQSFFLCVIDPQFSHAPLRYLVAVPCNECGPSEKRLDIPFLFRTKVAPRWYHVLESAVSVDDDDGLC